MASGHDILEDYRRRWLQHLEQVEAWKKAKATAEEDLISETRTAKQAEAVDAKVASGELDARWVEFVRKVRDAGTMGVIGSILAQSQPTEFTAERVVIQVNPDMSFAWKGSRDRLKKFGAELSVLAGIPVELVSPEGGLGIDGVTIASVEWEVGIEQPKGLAIELRAREQLGWDAPPGDQVDPLLDRYLGRRAGAAYGGDEVALEPVREVLRLAEKLAIEHDESDLRAVLRILAKHPPAAILSRARAIEKVAKRESVSSYWKLFTYKLQSASKEAASGDLPECKVLIAGGAP